MLFFTSATSMNGRTTRDALGHILTCLWKPDRNIRKYSKPGFKLVISVPILIHFVHFASWKWVQSMTTTMAPRLVNMTLVVWIVWLYQRRPDSGCTGRHPDYPPFKGLLTCFGQKKPLNCCFNSILVFVPISNNVLLLVLYVLSPYYPIYSHIMSPFFDASASMFSQCSVLCR